MDFLEKNLEQIIYESDTDILSERGLVIYGKLIRQVQIGGYGIADLIEYERPRFDKSVGRIIKGHINILELKKNYVDCGTFLQAIKYLKGISRYL
jgi:hypothetical protein